MSARTAFPKLAVTGRVDRLLVVLGDQLDSRAEPLRALDQGRDAVLMMEVAEEATHVASHKQRTTLFLSAMRHFALELAERGVRVQYVRLDDPRNTQSFDGEVRRQVNRLRPRLVQCVHPGEWRVLDMMQAWQRDAGVELTIAEDGHFLTSRDEFAEWAGGRKTMLLEHFYRWQRRRLGVMVDADGNPEGGRWNFDRDNRESLDRRPDVPRPYQPRPDAVTREVMDLVGRRFADAPGSLDRFHWPVTRTEALRALRDFIESRLPRFGTWQDAMWTDEPSLFHARLSAPLNLKLLHPRECVEAAVEAYERGDAPLNCVEGFVRQIIGWREFIRGVYWHEGRGYRRRNRLRQRGRLPDLYWSGDSDMRCMAQSVGQVLDQGYGHHIQRLMVTGNFALLAGVHPAAVADWYLGMYVDGVDWVTLPNTSGMAMHADGGVVGTKPYAASGRYIQRMSNYCESCRYDPARRSGEGACPFTVLYWDFLLRHRKRLGRNQRMALVLKNVDRLSKSQRAAVSRDAGRLRRRLGVRLSGGRERGR